MQNLCITIPSCFFCSDNHARFSLSLRHPSLLLTHPLSLFLTTFLFLARALLVLSAGGEEWVELGLGDELARASARSEQAGGARGARGASGERGERGESEGDAAA
eukprot:570114-Rhodomonas_salina.1